MGHKFNANSRASTRCYIINNSTKKKFTFQFNPTSLPYERSANYPLIQSPGMSYPLSQYSGGNVREVSVDVFYYDKPYTGKIKKAHKFLDALLPPEKNKKSFKKPPTFTFAYGYFVRKYILLSKSVKDEELDASGRPTQCTITLKMRQVGV